MKNIGLKHDKDKAIYTGDVGAENLRCLKLINYEFDVKYQITLHLISFTIKRLISQEMIVVYARFLFFLEFFGISKKEIHLAFIALIRHGAEKYGIGNWRLVDNAIERYTNALCRHVEEWVLADDVNCLDKDSGLPVYAHIIANCIFLSKLLRGK